VKRVDAWFSLCMYGRLAIGTALAAGFPSLKPGWAAPKLVVTQRTAQVMSILVVPDGHGATHL
jgi:hypothetical protein